MIKSRFHILCLLGTLLASTPVVATAYEDSSVRNTAENEIARRQEYLARAREAVTEGDKAMKQKDYETAVTQYRTAVDLLHDSESTHALRQRALDGFCVASVKLAEQRIDEGRIADAQNTAKLVLDDRYDPNCREAIRLLAHLQESDYYNKTITPKFRANVDQVKQWFVDAKGFYETGRYDLAVKRYEQILNLDPYNIAARKGEEQVNHARDEYFRQAYDEHRSRMVAQVDDEWGAPIRKYGERELTGPPVSTQTRSTDYITNKLNRIIIPKINFTDATVREAVDFLKQKSVTLDTSEPDPNKRGVNIVLKLDTGEGSAAPAAPAAPAVPSIPGVDTTTAAPAPAAAPPSVAPSEARITLSLSEIPLMEALRYITNLAGLKIKVEPYAVSIVPLSEPTDILVTKEYRVPPGFIPVTANAAGGAGGSLAAAGGGGGGGRTASAPEPTGAGNTIGPRTNARDFLEQQGVVFPNGSSAVYIPNGSRLIVRNTQEALDLIDTLVESQSPSQVTIESKFVEIQQTNLKELSFDSLLGQFSLNNNVFGGGGTVGNGTTLNPSDYPFVAPGSTVPVGANPLTSGNRSGSNAIANDAINSLLSPSSGVTSVAPAVLSLAGVFSQPQFQIVMRALNQKKGVDLLSSPSITTKSGQRATIEIIREFRYPTEFEPPQIPTTFAPPTGSITGGGATSPIFPVTPTTPTAFETRNTGVTLEVDPTVGPDGYTIDLTLVPQVVEFEGFINYGSPIQTINPSLVGLATAAVGGNTSGSVVLTANVINQPIFSTRKITTSVTIWDGATVCLGGLIREDIQKTDDKVPLLGDLPVLGRLFRSSADQHIKVNLVIFVTARLINPAGEPIQTGDEEKEEVVEPLAPETAPAPSLPESPLFQK